MIDMHRNIGFGVKYMESLGLDASEILLDGISEEGYLNRRGLYRAWPEGFDWELFCRGYFGEGPEEIE